MWRFPNRDISKSVATDIRNHNTKMVSRVIEDNGSLKVLRQKLSEGQKQLLTLRDKQGKPITNKEEILQITGHFYT